MRRSEEGNEELRCVLAVVRHGDRTPKQKMKMKVTQVSTACPVTPVVLVWDTQVCCPSPSPVGLFSKKFAGCARCLSWLSQRECSATWSQPVGVPTRTLNIQDLLPSLYVQLHLGFSTICMHVSLHAVHLHWTANHTLLHPAKT